MIRRIPFNVAAAVVCAISAAGLLISDILFPSAAPTQLKGQVVAASKRSVENFPDLGISPDPEFYTAIDNRPVFSPSRRPPLQITNTAAGQATPSPIDFSLIGVVSSPDQRLALITLVTGGSAIPVRLGSTIEGWFVTAINDSSIVVRQGTTSKLVKIVP